MGDIFSEHGVIKPGRGKGTRVSRTGRKSHGSTAAYGRTTSPNEEALQQLNRLLEEHDGIPSEVRQQYVGLYRSSDSLRHMNRPVLAEVMALMYRYQIGATGDQGEVSGLHVFSNPLIMQPYIDRVFTRTETGDQRGKISDLQKRVMSIKMTDTMFSYLRNILHLISTSQQRSRAADLSTLVGPAIDQQLDIVPDIGSDQYFNQGYPGDVESYYPALAPEPVAAPSTIPTQVSSDFGTLPVVDISDYQPRKSLAPPQLF